MALAANDAADRVDQLTILTERLADLTAQQCQAFERHRPVDAGRLMEEVSRLANLYRHESSRVRADPKLVLGAPAELRQRLVRATEAFDAVLHRYGRAVDAAKTVTEGLVRAIAEEVANQRQKGQSYGANATASTAGATAITLNKRA